MKGIVFKELIGMVETHFGEEMVEKIIDQSDLPSEGAYTAIGTYDHAEILSLVTELSKETQTPVPDLVKAFGKHLTSTFYKGYPDFFKTPDLFSFLTSVDSIIHIEVQKLYPEAELPQFEYESPKENQLIIKYKSKRPFADLAEGLIDGAIDHFKETVQLTSEDTSNGTGCSRTFTLTKG